MEEPQTAAHQALKEMARQLPQEPGVYLFKDTAGKVLYVGKAKSLLDRVRSYFSLGGDASAKTQALMKRVVDLDYMGARNEIEALVLECNLIKEYKPRYNIRLRDDKKYPYIRITLDEFPRIFVTRNLVDDGSQYFGPYSDVGAMRSTLALLQRVFQIRPCTPESLVGIDRPCLYYDIKMCQAPCVGLQEKPDYVNAVDHVRLFLQGHTRELVQQLRQQMHDASEVLDFENAARQRDQIRAIGRITDRMRTLVSDEVDRDAVTLRRDGPNACGLIMKIRERKLMASETFYLNERDESDEVVFTAFFEQYYNSATSIPQEILVSHTPANIELLALWLSDKRKSKVHISQPKRGDKLTLVNLALKNATLKLDEWVIAHGKADKRVPDVIVELQTKLGVARLPRKIECFDISNFQGSHPVASLVHFAAGEPDKSHYRHFRITGITAPNDFAMMEHVVERHFRSLLKEGQALPDLVMVDGGKGQLQSARKAMDRLQIADRVALIGLAKKQEEIFRFGHVEPLLLPRTSASLKLLQRIRDEAHRFAITYHRKRRNQEFTRSALDDIPGVGPKTRLMLLRHFGSVAAIGRLEATQLAQLPGIGATTAERILSVLSHPALQAGSTYVKDPTTADPSSDPTAPAEPDLEEIEDYVARELVIDTPSNDAADDPAEDPIDSRET